MKHQENWSRAHRLLPANSLAWLSSPTLRFFSFAEQCHTQKFYLRCFKSDIDVVKIKFGLLICLVRLVCLVCLVRLVCLVPLVCLVCLFCLLCLVWNVIGIVSHYCDYIPSKTMKMHSELKIRVHTDSHALGYPNGKWEMFYLRIFRFVLVDGLTVFERSGRIT